MDSLRALLTSMVRQREWEKKEGNTLILIIAVGGIEGESVVACRVTDIE